MTGALVGAHRGLTAVPTALLDKLEDGANGRTYLMGLARSLHERYRTQNNS
jgi:hypothetical protein